MRPFADTKSFFTIQGLYAAFTRTLEKDYYFAGQQHDWWELVIITEGQVGVTAGTDVFRLKKGQAVIHEPMEFHRIWTEGEKEAEIVIFTFISHSVPPYFSKVFSNADLYAAKELVQQLRINYTTHQIALIDVDLNMGIQPQLALKALETFILRLLSEQANIPPLSSRSARNYSAIVKVMEDHIHENLSIAEIAALCNLGEANLKLTFSRYAGMGVMQYFNRLKVTRAIEMIQKGASVQEAATALGFANQNYFSTVFKRVTGKAPSSYKPE